MPPGARSRWAPSFPRTVRPVRASSSSSGTTTRRLVPSACRAWLSGELPGQPGEGLDGAVVGPRQEHHAVGDAQQLARPHERRELPRAEAELGEPGRRRVRRTGRRRGRRAAAPARRRARAREPAARAPGDAPVAVREAGCGGEHGVEQAGVGQPGRAPGGLRAAGRGRAGRRGRGRRRRPASERAAAAACSGSTSQPAGARRPSPATGTPIATSSALRTTPRRAQLGAGSGTASIVASSAARAAAAPRRRSSGGRTSSTVTPASTRRRPGSRSTARSPTRSGSGWRSRSRTMSAPERAHPGGHRGRADVQDELARAGSSPVPSRVGCRRTSSVGDGQPRAGGEQRVAAGDGLARHPAQVHRHPGHPARRLDGRAAGSAARARRPALALRAGQLEPVAGAQAPGRQRAGDDGAGAAHGERAVDPQPHVGGRRPGRAGAATSAAERGAQRRPVPAPVTRGDRDGRRRRPATCRPGAAGVGEGEVGIRRSLRVTTSSPSPDAEGASASRCSADCGIQPSSAATTSSTAGHRSDPGEHRRDEPLVARHVDERDRASPSTGRSRRTPGRCVMPRRRSSAKRSGSIPVSARTSVDLPWSTCPAVATRAASARRQHRARPPRSSSPPGATARRSSRQRPCSSRPSTAGSPGAQGRARSAPAARRPRWAASTPGAPPPPTVAVESTPSRRPRPRQPRGERLGAGAQQVRGLGVQRGPDRRDRAAQRRLQRRQRQLVDAHRAGQRMPADPLDERSARAGRAEQQPGLRAAEQLVARGGHQRGARRPARCAASGSSGSSGCGASRPEPMSTTTRHRRSGRPARRPHGAREAADARSSTGAPSARTRCPGRSRRRSRPQVRAVGRADLAEPGARGLSRSGRRNPSPISTSSPARDDDLPPGRPARPPPARARRRRC